MGVKLIVRATQLDYISQETTPVKDQLQYSIFKPEEKITLNCEGNTLFYTLNRQGQTQETKHFIDWNDIFFGQKGLKNFKQNGTT